MSFSAYGSNKRDYGSTFDTTSLTDKSVDGNFKTLKVMDTEVLTSAGVSGKLDKTGGTMSGDLTLKNTTFTSTQNCNGTNINTLGTLPTAFGSTVPPDGDYFIVIGAYNLGTTTPYAYYTAYGTVSIASGAYTNLSITAFGVIPTAIVNVFISPSSSLNHNAIPVLPSTYTCFVSLTLTTNLSVTGATKLYGSLGVTGASTINGSLGVTGATTTNNLLITNANYIEMGNGVSGKELNAGKIGYQTFTTGALDIVGAGTTAGSRNIKLFENVTIPGTLALGNTDTVNTYSLLSTTTGGPGPSSAVSAIFGWFNPSSGSGFIVTGSGAVTGTTIPAGSYIVDITMTGGQEAFSYTGAVTSNGSNFTGLTTINQGSAISIVSMNLAMQITYTSAAAAPTATNYYRVTLTPINFYKLQTTGNVLIRGPTRLTNVLTLAPAGLSASSTTYTAANVKSSLDLGVSGGTMGGLLTLNTAGLSANSTTYTAAQVKTALDAANAALPRSGGTLTGPLTITPATYTATQACNGTTINTLGAIATGFNSVPPDGDYNLTIGVFLAGNVTINSTRTAYGTVSIASGVYTNLVISSSGGNVASVTVSTSSLTLTTLLTNANSLNCFVWLTPVTSLITSGAISSGGAVTAGGLLTLNTAGLSAGSTTFTAAQVKTALNNGSGTFSSDLTMSADKKIILPTSYTTAPTTLQLGGVDSGSVTAFNLTSGTTKSFGPFSTTNPGSYIVVATFLFNSGTYTQLKVGISTSTSFSTNYVSDGATNSAMTTSASNYISRQVTDFLSNTTASTFYLIVQGTFTGTGTVFPSFQLMRIA